MSYDLIRITYITIQLTLTFTLFYFSGKVLLMMYTLSPLYKGTVPYVPTKRAYMKKGFEMLDIKEGDKVVDLGCGNGQFLTYGARHVEAFFVGIELNYLLWLIAVVRSALFAKKGDIRVLRKSYYDEDLADYDKIFLFNMPSELKRLRPKLEKEVVTGTLVVSVMFPIKSSKFKLKESYGENYKLFLYEKVD